MSDTAYASGVYYDPYDFEIDNDPYPVWTRLRNEAPLYYNEKYDFYALSRWDDVERALMDWDTFRSGYSTTFEIIQARTEMPPGIILFEDPPIHDAHRSLLSRVFTPRRMNAIEPLVRQFCAGALDKLVGEQRFDVIAHLGALVPMRTIGYLLGIPEEDQEAIRKTTDDSLMLASGEPRDINMASLEQYSQMLAEYVDWRAEHPGSDLLTELLNAELEEPDGTKRHLTRNEVITYTTTIAGAGNETATRLIGFMTQLLAEHPDQRRQLVDDRTLLPKAVEETLRYEAPSPVQARWVSRDVELHDQTVRKDSIMLILNGSANRDERHFSDPDRYDIRRDEGGHLSFGRGLHFCLGAALARLEGRVAIDELLTRWPEWEIDYDNAAKAHTASVRGWASLPVVVGPAG
jgi:cytochrome P450